MLKLIAVLLVVISTNAAEHPLQNGTNITNEGYDVITVSSGYDVALKSNNVTNNTEDNTNSSPIQSIANADNNTTFKRGKYFTTMSNDVSGTNRTANLTTNKDKNNSTKVNENVENNIDNSKVGLENTTESKETLTEQRETSQKQKPRSQMDKLETYFEKLTLSDVNIQVLYSNRTNPKLLKKVLMRAFGDFYLKNTNLKNITKKITFKMVDCQSKKIPFFMSDLVAMFKRATLVVGPVCDRPYQAIGLLEKFSSVVVVPGDQVIFFFYLNNFLSIIQKLDDMENYVKIYFGRCCF